MTQFIAFLFLLMMTVPALLAISIGSRSTFGYIWNGIWFYIIGQTAQVAFESPDAQFISVILMIIFIWRSLVFKPRSTFQFQGPFGRNFTPRSGAGANADFGRMAAQAWAQQFQRRGRNPFSPGTGGDITGPGTGGDITSPGTGGNINSSGPARDVPHSGSYDGMREVIEAEVVKVEHKPKPPADGEGT
jgi:hypothetical protein